MAYLLRKFNLAYQNNTISVQLRASEEDKSLWEARESALEQKIEDSNDKVLKLESYWLEAQDLCKSVNEQLSETQSQYETLDKKYNKAKKLLKDYQQKWVCFELHGTALSEGSMLLDSVVYWMNFFK